MKHAILLLLIAFYAGRMQAQEEASDMSYATMSLDVVSPLLFVYSSNADLVQQKILPKAIKLRLKVKQQTCIVSAQVNINNTNNSPFADRFYIKLSQTSSPNVNSSGNDVNLSGTPVYLFMQPKSLRGVKQYDYFFDLKLNPPTTFGGPAITGFSIIYTISLQ